LESSKGKKEVSEFSLLGKALAGIDVDRGVTPATRSIVDTVRVGVHRSTTTGEPAVDAYLYSRGRKVGVLKHLEKD